MIYYPPPPVITDRWVLFWGVTLVGLTVQRIRDLLLLIRYINLRLLTYLLTYRGSVRGSVRQNCLMYFILDTLKLVNIG